MSSRRFPFAQKRALVGTVHLLPLPGSPFFKGDLDGICDAAFADAAAYAAGGAHGLIVENFGDAPFHPGRVPPHTVALMAHIATELGRRTGLPLGINVLRNDGQAALGVALAAGASFVRINVFTGVVATDQGIIQGRAHAVLRYRAAIGSTAAVFADVDVKHGRTLSSCGIAQSASDAFRRGGADALIITGSATGMAPPPEDLEAVSRAVPEAPLVAGSGVTPDNAPDLLRAARAAIVGTWCKFGGDIAARVDRSRVSRLARVVGSL